MSETPKMRTFEEWWKDVMHSSVVYSSPINMCRYTWNFVAATRDARIAELESALTALRISAMSDKYRVRPNEEGEGGETWAHAFADCDMVRMEHEGELTTLRQRAEEAEAENARLCELLYGAKCVYCGEVVGKEHKNQDIADDVLKQHIEQCPKHPVAALRAELARVREAETQAAELLRRMITGYDGEADEVGWENLVSDIRSWVASRAGGKEEGE